MYKWFTLKLCTQFFTNKKNLCGKSSRVLKLYPIQFFFFEFFVKMDLDCFQWHIFNTCVSFNILVLYMLKNNNYTCLKKTIHFLMKILIEIFFLKMSYIQWFHLCSLGTKWTYLQIFVKYSLKLSFIFFKQNYVLTR